MDKPNIVEIRVREICKDKGLRMADLAARVGMTQSNLIASIRKNPKLNTLDEIAKALGVEAYQFFSKDAPTRPSGVVMVDGKVYTISEPSYQTVQLPSYMDFQDLRKDIASFVKDATDGENIKSICGLVETFEMFTLVYYPTMKQFFLTLCYGKGKSIAINYDYEEYMTGVEIPRYNYSEVAMDIINDIEGAAIQKQTSFEDNKDNL